MEKVIELYRAKPYGPRMKIFYIENCRIDDKTLGKILNIIQ